jgi:hypothetical protein
VIHEVVLKIFGKEPKHRKIIRNNFFENVCGFARFIAKTLKLSELTLKIILKRYKGTLTVEKNENIGRNTG